MSNALDKINARRAAEDRAHRTEGEPKMGFALPTAAPARDPRSFRAYVEALNESDPLRDERLILAALGLPPLADDDSEVAR